MTGDEVRGTLAKLEQVVASPDFKFYIEKVKDLADKMLVQDFNAKGEEAVRALGVQKGLSMAANLVEIYRSNVQAQASAQIIKPR